MPKKARFPLSSFRIYLISEVGLSASTAESYVKRVRAAAAVIEDTAFPAERLRTYDAGLTLKAQENFRAAWRHFRTFAAARGTQVGEAPSKASR